MCCRLKVSVRKEENGFASLICSRRGRPWDSGEMELGGGG